jgi:phosphatidate cytidylyltransferase
MISKNINKRIITSLMLFFLIFLISKYNLILAYSLIVLGTLSILEFLDLTKKIIKSKFQFFISNFFFIFYIFIFCFMFFFFSNFFQLKLILFIILLGCIASDIGGFIVGKTIKGPKLSKISPNKTISGAFGSLILTALVMTCLVFFLTKNFNYIIIILAVIISIACQIGDLFFSFLKRKAKIKDTGHFLPGHGGILDRLDGILLGIPTGFISLTIFY